MSHQLINHSPDLKRLRDEEYEVAVRNNYLLISGVPYVNSEKKIAYGTLVSELTVSGIKAAKPSTHVVHFIGDQPCYSNGAIIEPINHSVGRKELSKDIVVDRMFSNKPKGGYPDYYEKMTRYVTIIENEAKALNKGVSAKSGRIPISDNEDPVFNYPDTNSSRAEINKVSDKLRGQRIAIVGLGGTGSYVLDFVAKTPVAEIHLFDKDKFLVHNAFRAPGAPKRADLNELKSKVAYFESVYSQMHKGIVTHEEYLDESNLDKLARMTFVFLCLDVGSVKPMIIEFLEKHGIPFIDVGIGITLVEEDSALIGQVRVTASTESMRKHIHERALISFAEDDEENQYSKNIQIAELNGMNAAMAVMKWKKHVGFYQDLTKEHHSVYSINDNSLNHEDEA